MQLDIGLFFGGAYLSYWLLIGLVAAWRWGRTAWQRRGAVKRLFDARQDQGDNSGYILVLAFAVGGMLALTVLREVPAYWLLLGLPVLVMALDEMSDIQRRAISTEIIVMIEKYRVAAAKGLAGALSDVLDWLPDGQLRSAIEDAQYKRWENKTPAECLRKLRRLNSHTREFVDALAQANYEAGAVMEASLSMLLENKKSTWASQSRANQVLKRLLPAIPPVRLFALGGLTSAFIVSLFAKEIDFSNLQPTGGAVIGTALLGIWVILRMVTTQPWLRRALSSALVVILLLSLTSLLQDITLEAAPVLAAPDASPTFTLTPPPPPMLPTATQPNPPVSPPTGKPATDAPRDPTETPGTTPGVTSPTPIQPTPKPTDTPPPPPSEPTNTAPPPPPTNSPVPPPNTPPPAPEDATSTPPSLPGGINP